jgi:hypothetical protein
MREEKRVEGVDGLFELGVRSELVSVRGVIDER